MSNPSPVAAAFLSFLFPGAGQVYAGRTRRGIAWAIPMVVLLAAAVVVLLGGSSSLTSFLTADKTLALLVLDLALFIYHVAAMIDAYTVARRVTARPADPATPRTGLIAVAALVALTIVLH